MADPNELKILVKKSDGSYVHVPISELQKKGVGSAPQLLKPAQKPVTVSVPVVPAKSSEPAKPQPPAATQQKVPEKRPETPAPKPVQSVVAVPEKKPEPKTAPPPATLPVQAGSQQKPVATEKNIEQKKPAFDQKENERLEKELPAVVGNLKTEAKAKIEQKPAKTETKVLPTQAGPVEKPQPLKVEMDKSDTISLLEEELPVVSKLAPLTSSTREKQVEEILKNLSFKIPQGNESRFRTIIQLFLKEVRGEAETKEILERPDLEGGVGLSETQAKEVIEKCRKTTLPAQAAEPVPSLKLAPKPQMPAVPVVKEKLPIKAPSDNEELEKLRLEKELPAVKNNIVQKPEPVPASAPKANPVVAEKQPVLVSEKKPGEHNDARKRLEEQITRATLSETGIQNFKLNPERNRTVMQDVKSVPVQMGPIEEIRYFSLTDFRRLSADPAEAAKRLKQKFINLAEESVLLFFEALEAWKSCPLHHDYLKLVSEALLKKRPLIQIATDKTRIQIAEIAAIIQMERELD